MKKFGRILAIAAATTTAYIVGPVLTLVSSMLIILFLIFRLYGPALAVEKAWAFGLFLSVGKVVHFRGREKLQKHKSYVIVANHSSLFDIPAMTLLKKDFSAFLAKESLFRVPVFGNALALGVCIPVNRSDPRRAKEALRKATLTMRQRQSVVVYPEGSRTLDGELQPFKRGFVKIMRDTGKDVLPVTLNGFYTLMPKATVHRYICPVTRLEIVVGDPIPYGELKDLDDGEVIERVRAAVAKEYEPPARND